MILIHRSIFASLDSDSTSPLVQVFLLKFNQAYNITLSFSDHLVLGITAIVVSVVVLMANFTWFIRPTAR